MIELTTLPWLDQHLHDPGLLLVDPRPITKYLSGHIPGAVNLPLAKIFDSKTLSLRPENELAQIVGDSGVGTETTVVLYDSYDGQSGAMLAWVLEYLGHPNIRILSDFFDRWVSSRHEVLYRPVKPRPSHLTATPNSHVRISAEELWMKKDAKLLDLRSDDEFQGRIVKEVRSGHIPGAVSLPWTSLLGQGSEFLRQRRELEEITSGIGLVPGDSVITYCSYGPRAAVGYVALQQIGYHSLQVYDASFHQWAQHQGLPVEGEVKVSDRETGPIPYVGC